MLSRVSMSVSRATISPNTYPVCFFHTSRMLCRRQNTPPTKIVDVVPDSVETPAAAAKEPFLARMKSMFAKKPAAGPKPEPVLGFPEQSPQYFFPEKIEGIPVYMVDTDVYKDFLRSYAPPIGTLSACLAALSLYTWDAASMSVWVIAGVFSGLNLYAKKLGVTRIFVTTNNFQESRRTPKHANSKEMQQISKIHVEYIGLPFLQRPVESFEITPFKREPHLSYLKSYVFPGDIKEAHQHKMTRRIIFDLNGKRLYLNVDQIRNADYFNQILTYVQNKEKDLYDN